MLRHVEQQRLDTIAASTLPATVPVTADHCYRESTKSESGLRHAPSLHVREVMREVFFYG
jgi:hypothetical protein